MQTETASDIEINATVDRVTYRNDENGYSVVRLKTRQNDLGITGIGYFPSIRKGEEFQFFGQWIEHKSFGQQFKIDRAVPLRPSNKKSILKYLSSGLIKGVGPKTAEKIVKKFGEETLNILDDEPHRLAELKSLPKKLRDSIILGWQENKFLHEVMMFLTNHGLSTLFANRIFKLYGSDSIKIVSQNPYKLATDISGIGFTSADKVAKSLGIAEDSEERIRAAIVYQMQRAEGDGHCFLTTRQLTDRLVDTLNLSSDRLLANFPTAMATLEQNSVLFSESGDDEIRHFLRDLIICESNVASKIKELVSTPIETERERVNSWLERYTEAAHMKLSEQQISSVLEAACNRLFILTGGPGVGKTTAANTIIRLFKAMGKTVALCAPTGRAAQRLSEVSGFEARTIHRLLEWNPSEGGFLKDESNPIAAQVIICDESSMLDIRLADALFRATSPTTQIVLIGDVDQLPSVGPGNVLRDLIDSDHVPFIRLDKIFRQAKTSNIVSAAHKINSGEMPDFRENLNSDCQFRDCETPVAIKEKIKDFIQYEAKKYGFDPIKDVQVLTPMNRGELGTQNLNQEIQEIINPKRSGMQEFKRGNFVIRPHDKVIQVANNYELGVFNGDIGTVLMTNVEDGQILVQYGDRQVSYTDDSILDLRLAYAITIHKSQGSEFPVAIIPLSMQHFVMLQRNLYYTGLTRAKKLAIFVGIGRALNVAIKNQSSQNRQTALISRIINGD